MIATYIATIAGRTGERSVRYEAPGADAALEAAQAKVDLGEELISVAVEIWRKTWV